MKFDQLTEYNKKNIFLEKSYRKRSGEASHVAFYADFFIQFVLLYFQVKV